jgi:Na+-driven multidrug efflux pump
MDIIRDIMRVGVPASLQQMSMSFNMIFLNAIVLEVGGDPGVAVFSTGWRVSSIAILPLMGIATALVSVAGAAYGARAYKKLKLSWIYAIKYGLKMEMPVSLILFIFAPIIVLAFTWSEGSSEIRGDMIVFLRFFSLMPFTAALGMLSGSVFQAIGKGFNSLIVTILRTVVLSLLFAYMFGIALDWGLQGVWGGILLGNATGALIGYLWVRFHLNEQISGRLTGE